jgi:hypothetical protein
MASYFREMVSRMKLSKTTLPPPKLVPLVETHRPALTASSPGQPCFAEKTARPLMDSETALLVLAPEESGPFLFLFGLDEFHLRSLEIPDIGVRVVVVAQFGRGRAQKEGRGNSGAPVGDGVFHRELHGAAFHGGSLIAHHGAADGHPFARPHFRL